LADSIIPEDETFPLVQIASFGGELTPIPILAQARKRFPNAILSIGFSSTESVQAGFSCTIEPSQDLSKMDNLMFSPNANIEELILLDDEGRKLELLPGASGRVCLKTRASADPYLYPPDDEETKAAAEDTFRKAKDGTPIVCLGDHVEYHEGHKVSVVMSDFRLSYYRLMWFV